MFQFVKWVIRGSLAVTIALYSSDDCHCQELVHTFATGGVVARSEGLALSNDEQLLAWMNNENNEESLTICNIHSREKVAYKEFPRGSAEELHQTEMDSVWGLQYSQSGKLLVVSGTYSNGQLPLSGDQGKLHVWRLP